MAIAASTCAYDKGAVAVHLVSARCPHEYSLHGHTSTPPALYRHDDNDSPEEICPDMKQSRLDVDVGVFWPEQPTAISLGSEE